MMFNLRQIGPVKGAETFYVAAEIERISSSKYHFRYNPSISDIHLIGIVCAGNAHCATRTEVVRSVTSYKILTLNSAFVDAFCNDS